MTVPIPRENALGLSKSDYGGLPSTLCKGCGHNSIANQIVQVAFELNLKANEVIKLSGIGCSSKSPAYFLGMSHGFNALHGRMPVRGDGRIDRQPPPAGLVGVSGDGDTGSIGMGQFKHICRRNVRMVYIVENNGVYGLTKGQFSATADEGLELKYAGHNELPAHRPLHGGDRCRLLASLPAPSRETRPRYASCIKAAMSHRGIAVLDIISPCVAFNNKDFSTMSYGYGKDHEMPIHEVGYIPMKEEIQIDGFEAGDTRVVQMHDGSYITLKKLEEEYDPGDRVAAMNRLMTAHERNEFITGLLYYNPERPNLAEVSRLPDTPLAALPEQALRPSREQLQAYMNDLL
jgi:2-oxoglutarate/2-oxoacid ferredoxin oxidoreductase subunit beta